jgi:TetR/AcrR family transcriptional regulator, repressor for uid operon
VSLVDGVSGRGELPDDDVARAILAAAREEFVRFGFRRASVEEIARRADVSRVTVYRRFESKSQLLRAVVMEDLGGFLAVLDAELFAEGRFAGRLEAVVLLSVRAIRRYPLLNTVLRADPGTVLQSLTIDGCDAFEFVRNLFAARIDELVRRGEIHPADGPRAAEAVTRLAYTIVLLPHGLLPGTTEEEIRAFARDFVVPLLSPGMR